MNASDDTAPLSLGPLFAALPQPGVRGPYGIPGAALDVDEATVLAPLLELAALPPPAAARVKATATRLVEGVRQDRRRLSMIDAFLGEFGLDSREGVALMCVAEALLRIPDATTADALLRDKIGTADWTRHLGHTDSLLVNASTWALMLTGRVMRADEAPGVLNGIIARSGEPVIRQALVQAMRILGHQFILGRTIGEALDRAGADTRAAAAQGVPLRHSFDMLGEGARTATDADGNFDRYLTALRALGGVVGSGKGADDIIAAPSLSVKLSALHPRYEEAQADRVRAELGGRLLALCRAAADLGVAVTVDAEEAERLPLSLDLIATVADDPELAGWDGLGLAVQAYQKRALAVLDWVHELAGATGQRLAVRLVKGAYWDSEIKRAQERGLAGYPVFTRKANTDVSYLACAARLLGRRDTLFPMFATHNAQTVAAVLEMAGRDLRGFEFQRLHGMGEPLYHQLAGMHSDIPCRVYAPVGGHQDLLAYLARRLLENGANTSFVNRLRDEQLALSDIIVDPVAKLRGLANKAHPRIPLPAHLFDPERRNAAGLDLSDREVTARLQADMQAAWRQGWKAAPLIAGKAVDGDPRPVLDPADHGWVVGEVADAIENDIGHAIAVAHRFAHTWDATPADQRADCLDRMAGLLEGNRAELMALLVREAGKTIPDALGEVREAVDFCRYYAARARDQFARPQFMPGPTGETNELSLYGRGVFACISPWNFPLSIFLGQVVAALVAGNAVVAKPAEQTPLIAARAVKLLFEAGIPVEALHLVPGDRNVGAMLINDHRIAGVAFTGSTLSARHINHTLANRPGPIVPLIAETGGINALIADSSALPEQLVDDVVAGAFRSAGQRCSALRVLFLPESSAAKVLAMLGGAMTELRLGDPGKLETDIGPVIDQAARERLERHAAGLSAAGRGLFKQSIAQAAFGNVNPRGTFFAPRVFALDSMAQLQGEVFGPILHVVRYRPDRLDQVLEQVNASGYGLTLGVHSRIGAVAEHIRRHVAVGNVYVNRNMVGAVVGVQPFGGEGLSGTGPKAGGPRYLLRFALERTYTVNTTAAGGNTALVSLSED